MIVEYERTWCDYLTHCPFGEEAEVGSYKCSKCPSFERSLGELNLQSEPCNYGRYSEILTGEIICSRKTR